jgi:putative ABC transport system substrate-binding protein
MRRRQFIKFVGAAAMWPVVARAQQPGKLPTIGYLGGATAAAWSPWTAAFVARLRELGWIEGRTIAIEYRWAEGRPERYNEIATEFVRLKVDVIVTPGTAVPATKQATSTTPIIFAVAQDPVGAGYVASLARPGGNVTGLSLQQTDLAGKKVELLRQLIPGLRRLAIMVNVGNPAVIAEIGEVEAAARTFSLDAAVFAIRRSEDIASAFEALKGYADALYIVTDTLMGSNRIRLNTLAQGARLPTMYGAREFVEAGGLMSYAANFPDLFRRTAEFVDKILRGTKPAEMPVEQPTKFDLIVNLTTARALGLKISETFLARADEVIE